MQHREEPCCLVCVAQTSYSAAPGSIGAEQLVCAWPSPKNANSALVGVVQWLVHQPACEFDLLKERAWVADLIPSTGHLSRQCV